MLTDLPVVQIPGYREAARKERLFRDAAWMPGTHLLFGVEIQPLCLRRLLWLEQSQCGFICPWRFDDDAELVSHAVLFLWIMRKEYRAPTSPKITLVSSFLRGYRQHVFSQKLLRQRQDEQMVRDIKAYLDECYMDAPAGGGDNYTSDASYYAYVFDLLGAAGLTFTEDEIWDMPLPRLWQHQRIASQRLYGTKLTNPSDIVATNFLAQQNVHNR